MSSAPPLLALREAEIAFGTKTLFSDLNLGLRAGERACLVGRNGCGKSSLLKALSGSLPLDHGERFLQPGTRVAYLPQDPASDDPDFSAGITVRDYVTRGLPGEDQDQAFRVDATLETLEISGDRDLGQLSGGEGRRAALARALVSESRRPADGRADQPSGHRDHRVAGRAAGGASAAPSLMISHDRSFLRRLARSTLWLDRGTPAPHGPCPFDNFEAWAEEMLRRRMPWPATSSTARSPAKNTG